MYHLLKEITERIKKQERIMNSFYTGKIMSIDNGVYSVSCMGRMINLSDIACSDIHYTPNVGECVTLVFLGGDPNQAQIIGQGYSW